MDDNEIKEINENLTEIDTDLEQELYKRKRKIRITAIIVIITFTLFLFRPLIQSLNLPSLNFLKESHNLSKDPNIKKLKESVVEIKHDKKMGTGFNIRKDGLIVTNKHVIKDAEYININFLNGKKFTVNDYFIDKRVDLALIDIDANNLSYLKLGDSTDFKRNMEVLIIGNPLGYEKVVNKAKLLKKVNYKGMQNEILILKGPIHKGSSGSPVLNNERKVIGIVFATGYIKGIDERLGFAIAIKDLKNLLKEKNKLN
ncbi:MAG: serine protease [Firmicutes bacterium]|nr:serine protease [Bacillota bacterium]